MLCMIRLRPTGLKGHSSLGLNFGSFVNFGQLSGPADLLAMQILATKSLRVSRPIIFHYLNERAQYQQEYKVF